MATKSNVYLFEADQVRPTLAQTDTQVLMRKAEILRAEEAARIFGGIGTALKRLFRTRPDPTAERRSDDHKIAA